MIVISFRPWQVRVMNSLCCALLSLSALTACLTAHSAEKTLLLLAGRPSHPPGMHEFRAGCLLLQDCLKSVPGLTTLVSSNGWPRNESLLDAVDAVVIYADGGGGHSAIQADRLERLGKLIEKGVGFGAMHYACEVPANKGGKEFQEWIGGYYEHKYSVNPMWVPEFNEFPNHPVTRGVSSFAILDEWYFNMRWRSDLTQITPILVATPADKVRQGPYVWPKGPYDHIVANSGREETMMWVSEGVDGARGFGFTGGHYHKNWGNAPFRRVVLNALLWVTQVDVPDTGVQSALAVDTLSQNLDPKGK